MANYFVSAPLSYRWNGQEDLIDLLALNHSRQFIGTVNVETVQIVAMQTIVVVYITNDSHIR